MEFKPRKQIGVGDFVISEHEKKYLNEVINSSRLSYGPMTQQFELRFSKAHSCAYGVFCNSGTSALHVALAALKEKYKWQDGDEVIIPALTFVATCNVVLHNNLRPIFVDIEVDTYNIDPSKIEEKITDRTRCIIPVHLFGQPCDMGPIVTLSKKYNLRIIEDSCETMFATYRGKLVGSFGDISCFSTYMAHLLVTGVGGFCLTNDPELAVMVKSLINHGRDSIYLHVDDDKKKNDQELFNVISRRFNFVHLGYSFRATEFEAAMGLGQLDILDTIIRKRRENAEYYLENLQPLKSFLQLPHKKEDRDHNFMMYPIVLRPASPKTKEEVVQFLESNNIETRDLVPLLNQPIYNKIFGDIEKDYPVAEFVRKNGFYIGCHQYLSDEERAYVVAKLKEFFEK